MPTGPLSWPNSWNTKKIDLFFFLSKKSRFLSEILRKSRIWSPFLIIGSGFLTTGQKVNKFEDIIFCHFTTFTSYFVLVAQKPDQIFKNGLQVRDLRKISDRKRHFFHKKNFGKYETPYWLFFVEKTWFWPLSRD